jgi:hypothetical protein
MGKVPKVIRSDLGNGLETLAPYGISADMSDELRRLNAQYSKLARAYKHRSSKRAK